MEKMILGNKCDMTDRRQVSKDRGEKVSPPQPVERPRGNHEQTEMLRSHLICTRSDADIVPLSHVAGYRLRCEVHGNQRKV